MVAPFLPEKEKVAAIRDELPATGAGIYLDAATAGPIPLATDRAMREWSDWEARVGRGGGVADDEFGGRLDEARAAVAAILVTSPDRLRLAPGFSAALLEALAMLPAVPRGRVVAMGTLEPGFASAVRAIATLAGTDVVAVEDVPSRSPSSVADRVASALGDAPSLVCVAHVSPATGRLAALDELARIAHPAGAQLVVDGSLAIGAIPVDVSALGADVYLAAGDRWMCGPTGITAVWTAAATGRIAEATDLHRAAVVGFGRSAGWLAMQVGLDWAFARTSRLARSARDRLGQIDGVTSPMPDAGAVAGTISFGIRGWPASLARDQLRRRAFALVGLTPAGDRLRVGIGCWNTEEEIDRFVSAVAELAATTPEELPARPPILVISDPA